MRGETPGALAELRAGWRPLLACSVGIGLGLSPIPPYTASLFAVALERDFGWSRGAILSSISFVTLALILFGSPLGRFVDKHGTRGVAIASTACLGLSFAALAFITAHIWTFYACWALMCVGGLGTLPLVYGRVINGWFNKARGFALGVSFATTGVAGAVLPFYVQTVMDRFGWRAAYGGLALVPLLITLPILILFLKEPPAQRAAQAHEGLAGLTLREAMRQYRFWTMSLAGLLLGFAVGGVIPHLVPLFTERGYDLAVAMRAIAALALSMIGGRLLTGFLLDRLWGPLVGVLLAVPVLIALWLVGVGAAGGAATIMFGASLGLIAGAEFDLVAYITGRYFGKRHFSLIYGTQYSIFGAAAGAGPGLFGFLRDGTGGYDAMLVTIGLCLVGTVVALLALGRYPAAFRPAPLT